MNIYEKECLAIQKQKLIICSPICNPWVRPVVLLFFEIFKDALWVTMTIGLQAILEFLWILMYCVVLSAIYIAAPTGVPPAAATDCRLAQPVTPETVYSPTLAGRRSKPRNFIICLATAGIDPRPPARLSSPLPLYQPGKLSTTMKTWVPC